MAERCGQETEELYFDAIWRRAQLRLASFMIRVTALSALIVRLNVLSVERIRFLILI